MPRTPKTKTPPAQPHGPAAPDCTFVIFGAAGDLTRRLLVPALYNLALAGRLGTGFRVLGVDHNPCSEEDFRRSQTRFLQDLAADPASEFGSGPIDPKAWKGLCARLHYQAGDFEDDTTYHLLAERLTALNGGVAGPVIFYCATAPRFFSEVARRLAKAGLAREEDGFRRLVVEKPFGHDHASAVALNRSLLRGWTERQIFRIDHFLGKETVQNILVSRFANGMFEPLWNRAHIDHVQITACETVGVEGRGRFYDQTGALRDMTPNHLFQMLALTAMEAPNSLHADDINAEKAKLIEAVHRQTRAEAALNSVRGQYRAGMIGDRKVQSYSREPDVAKDSQVETYVALKLGVDNWRWAGVPFYLRTGKALGVRSTQVVIRFKHAPVLLFRQATGSHAPNDLVLQIQPDEGLTLGFDVKRPGPELELAPVQMAFRFADAFHDRPGVGYETLLFDCMIGDRTLFQSAQAIELAWWAVQPFLDAWSDGKGEVEPYRAGGSGPRGADTLLARDGRAWRSLDRG